MGKNLFKRGFKALEEEKKRQSEYQHNKSAIYRMYLKEGEANIVFINEEISIELKLIKRIGLQRFVE